MTHPPFRDIEIGLYSVSSTAENRAAARRAEARGFRRVWLAEDHHSRDIFVQATAIGVATEAIGIGLGIVNPFTRHPAQIAMAVADLEELAGPRFTLGLGAGWSSIAAHGLENPRPITALREAAEICRGMLGGARFAYEGSLYRLPAPGARLTFRPPRPGVPLYFGTMGPRTLRMAAPLADGVFFSVLASPAYVAHCLGHARAGLAAAGRDIGEIDAACYIIFSVDEDGDAARAAARGLIAHYLMRIPDTIRFEYAGLDVARMQSVQAGLRAAAAANRLGPAAEALDDDIVAALAVAGTPEECIAGLEPYAAAGLGTPVLYHVLGPDRLASIDLIAERIRPALAG